MNILERSKKITALLNLLFTKASKKKFSFSEKQKDLLEALFSTDAWGFREILLVILVARLLNNKYCASTAFYDCNPRALYEGPIRDSLRKRGIPHRKSGPLNIAKATIGINSQWAAQRRPQQVAENLVEIIKMIEHQSATATFEFAVGVCARFLADAKEIANLHVEINPLTDVSHIFKICADLIEQTPDAGNTPQKIIGLLLETYHKALKSGVIVSGADDRASTTSTTSKKPGDLNEELTSGEIIRVYEITTKPFSESRVIESFETCMSSDLFGHGFRI